MSEDHDEKKHKHCPFCGHHVDEEDMICPHCGLFIP
ncbi:zinc ribbon domain-containing protein [Methanobrevibacter smithii]